jgi:hypothetical protein
MNSQSGDAHGSRNAEPSGARSNHAIDISHLAPSSPSHQNAPGDSATPMNIAATVSSSTNLSLDLGLATTSANKRLQSVPANQLGLRVIHEPEDCKLE